MLMIDWQAANQDPESVGPLFSFGSVGLTPFQQLGLKSQTDKQNSNTKMKHTESERKDRLPGRNTESLSEHPGMKL